MLTVISGMRQATPSRTRAAMFSASARPKRVMPGAAQQPVAAQAAGDRPRTQRGHDLPLPAIKTLA